MRLKAICAHMLADEERDWFARLEDYEQDPLKSLIDKLREIQAQRKDDVLSESEIDELNSMRKTRNYWVHQCFGGVSPKIPVVLFKDNKVRYPEQVQMISDAFDDAVRWDEKLAEIIRTKF